MNTPAEEIVDKTIRRRLIDAIIAPTPTGAGHGQREAKKSRRVSADLGVQACMEGASKSACEALGIPPEWALRCEDSAHVVHDGNVSTLKERLDKMRAFSGFAGSENKMMQIGSCGGGNHFGKCEVV